MVMDYMVEYQDNEMVKIKYSFVPLVLLEILVFEFIYHYMDPYNRWCISLNFLHP